MLHNWEFSNEIPADLSIEDCENLRFRFEIFLFIFFFFLLFCFTFFLLLLCYSILFIHQNWLNGIEFITSFISSGFWIPM